jgi:hypothetical protein
MAPAPQSASRKAQQEILDDPHALAVGVGIIRLGEVNIEGGTFEATFVLRVAYCEPGLVGRGLLDSADRLEPQHPLSHWPDWEMDCPNRPLINERAFANAHEILASNVSNVMLTHNFEGVHVRGLVRMTIWVHGVFYEYMELEDFPYDVQKLSIHLRSTISGRDFHLVPWESETNFKFEFQLPDFDMYDPPLLEPFDEGDSYGHHRIVAKAVVKRKPAFYENNVFVMLCVITTIAFSSFCCNAPDDLSQNLENTLTLILTAAAFRFSMEDKLPAVHYMTILDKYILVSFVFMIAIVATSLVGSLVATPELESWLELIVFGGWVLFNFLFVVRRNQFQRQTHEALELQGLKRVAESEADVRMVTWKII